jgi:hypothetical protein
MRSFFRHPAHQLIACTGWVAFMPWLFSLVNALPYDATPWMAWCVASSMDLWTSVGVAWMLAAGLLFIPGFFLITFVTMAKALKGRSKHLPHGVSSR